jgi:two-component system OmpR family response regulator
MRTLIAEDDASIAAAIEAALSRIGHVVDHVSDGAHAFRALCDGAFDLLVLDLGLPGLGGEEVLRRLRGRGLELAILVITARDALRERVQVLDLGADDYLVKPFALSEFEARVRALLRRAITKGQQELRIGRLRINLAGQRVYQDDTPLEFTRREFGLLAALATRQEQISTRTQLVEALCSWDEELTGNGLDIAIYRLRRKLQGSGLNVRTIRGLGYLLEENFDA